MEYEFVEDLDEVARRMDQGIELRHSDNDAGNLMLDKLIYKYPASKLAELRSIDPFGEEFFESQMDLFRKISRKEHDLQVEGHDTLGDDISVALPYYMQPAEVGYWTVIYGHILQYLKLPKGAKVMEVGFGPGGLTELLVRAGLDVTAVEPNASNCEFVKKRVSAFGGTITAFATDLISADIQDSFDAIIFFESFHHVIDFGDVLKKCVNLLKPDGFFLFCADPIVEDDHPHVPFPRGLRTVGQPLSASCTEGWIELGFQDSFFKQMMEQAGFGMEKSYILYYHHSEIRACRRL